MSSHVKPIQFMDEDILHLDLLAPLIALFYLDLTR